MTKERNRRLDSLERQTKPKSSRRGFRVERGRKHKQEWRRAKAKRNKRGDKKRRGWYFLG